MYCPLCKAEYRIGFDKCSDCLVALVPTLEQAQSISVSMLWRGTSQTTFNEIVDALRDSNIPFLARSSANAENYYSSKARSDWDYIPYFGALKRMHEQMHWEVLVFSSDYNRAQNVIPGIGLK